MLKRQADGECAGVRRDDRIVVIVVGRVDPSRRDALEMLVTPLELPINWGFVAVDEMSETLPASGTCVEIAEETWREHKRLGLAANRGKIRREYFADLAVYEAGDGEGAPGAVRSVVVAGETVWADGKRTGKNAGTFLRCSGENRLC